jgi:hypothetical protein
MSILRTSAVVLSLAALTACSQTPVAKGSQTAQGVLSGPAQWQEIADQAALDVRYCLIGKVMEVGKPPVFEPSCAKFAPNLAGRTIYIDRMAGGTPFARALRDYTLTALVLDGQSVTNTPEGALRLSYRVHSVPRDGTVPMNSVPGKFSAATAMGGAYLALTNAQRAAWEAGLILAGASLVADLFSSTNSMNGDQIFVTLSLTDGDKNVMNRVGAYYIHDKDMAHYMDTSPAADIVMTHQAGGQPPVNRSFNVVSE